MLPPQCLLYSSYFSLKLTCVHGRFVHHNRYNTPFTLPTHTLPTQRPIHNPPYINATLQFQNRYLRRNLQPLIQDTSMPLYAHVLWPFHESVEVSLGRQSSSDTKLLRPLLKQRVHSLHWNLLESPSNINFHIARNREIQRPGYSNIAQPQVMNIFNPKRSLDRSVASFFCAEAATGVLRVPLLGARGAQKESNQFNY